MVESAVSCRRHRVVPARHHSHQQFISAFGLVVGIGAAAEDVVRTKQLWVGSCCSCVAWGQCVLFTVGLQEGLEGDEFLGMGRCGTQRMRRVEMHELVSVDSRSFPKNMHVALMSVSVCMRSYPKLLFCRCSAGEELWVSTCLCTGLCAGRRSAGWGALQAGNHDDQRRGSLRAC